MLDSYAVVTILLLIANGIVTNQGLKSVVFQQKYAFVVHPILVGKDYKRLITSGFLHVHWMHFGFNAFTLYVFGKKLEGLIGAPEFLLMYFASLIGGNLLALYIHRNHSNYSAVGASGAVSGLVFASIGLFPGMELSLFLLPIFIPAWLFGIGYVLYSIYGIRSQRDNIGHEAHLGGGLVGLLVAIVLYPASLTNNTLPILLILLPTLAFLLVVVKWPHVLFVKRPFSRPKPTLKVVHRRSTSTMDKQEELNRLLDKINAKGLDQLTAAEKQRLEELSR